MLNPLDAVVTTGSCRQFVVAVSRAQIPYRLDGHAPCTLIVPTDDAFSKLPRARRTLLTNNRMNGRQLIARHILPTRSTLSEMLRQRTVRTIMGASLAITVNTHIYIDGACVVKSDVHAQNGIIHLIDQVMIPSELWLMLNQAEPTPFALTGHSIPLTAVRDQYRAGRSSAQ